MIKTIEALDKENIVMRQQLVKLIDERNAFREALLALRSVVHTVHVDMGGYHRYGISNGSPTGKAIMLADKALKEVGNE